MKKIILITAISAICTQAQSQWSLTGNAGTNTSTNFIGTTDNKALKIRTNNIARMTITSSGKVGIGTSNPQDKLHVNGTGILARFGTGSTSTTNNYCYIDNTWGTYIERVGNTAEVGSDMIVIQSSKSGNTADYASFYTDPNRGFSFLNIGSGNNDVGIGAFSPGYKFYVRNATAGPVAFIENTGGTFNSDGLYIKAGSNSIGGIYFIDFLRPDGSNIGSIAQNGPSAVAYQTTSDRRLKDIIGASQKGLTDLMKINIYDYTFKTDPQKQVLTGFMAQELYEIFPQSVSKPRENNEPAEKNPWMVDYGSVTPLIIKSVQELNEELKAEVRNQKSENEKMKLEIENLKLSVEKLMSGKTTSQIVEPNMAKLEQNIPNPFNEQTVIRFYIPASAKSAVIKITDAGNKELNSFSISERGASQISISANTLAAGVYSYRLIIDEKAVDAKQMLITNK